VSPKPKPKQNPPMASVTTKTQHLLLSSLNSPLSAWDPITLVFFPAPRTCPGAFALTDVSALDLQRAKSLCHSSLTFLKRPVMTPLSQEYFYMSPDSFSSEHLSLPKGT
jgi:hypothetical protein